MNDPSHAANPYAAPQAPPQVDDRGPADGQGPDGVPLAASLYTPNHVALATFLGTPFGGAVLMALNEVRRSRRTQAVYVVLGGLAGTGVLFAIGYLLPDGFPSFPIGIGSLLAMGAIARSQQGALVHRHLAAGGKRGSGWLAAGIGILALIAVLVPLVVVLVVAQAATPAATP